MTAEWKTHEMYLYAVATTRNDNVIIISILGVTEITSSQVDVAKLSAPHLLSLIVHLGELGYICTPIDSTDAFWCYRDFWDWDDREKLIAEIRELTKVNNGQHQSK